jgi:hypothetical protein
MTARQKIENLTHAWYGYLTFTAIASLFSDGIPGPFAIVWKACGLGLTLFCAWFIGRRLLNKGSLTRAILLVVTGLGTLLQGYGVGKMALAFVRTWELSMLGAAVFLGVSVFMHARSFRVLTDSSVRTYFNT